jgi:MSHA biogenesis protein MshO
LGTVSNLASIATGSDFVAIYNLGAGFPNADAYATGAVTGGNKSLITSAVAGSGGQNVIAFQSNTFGLESPGRRFHVIAGPVSYVCDPGAGTLSRISAYAISAVQPTPPAGTSARVAERVTGCTIVYDQNVINQRQGLVSIWLRLADPAGGAAVNLFQQVQVSNVP